MGSFPHIDSEKAVFRLDKTEGRSASFPRGKHVRYTTTYPCESFVH